MAQRRFPFESTQTRDRVLLVYTGIRVGLMFAKTWRGNGPMVKSTCSTTRDLTEGGVNSGGVSRRWRAVRLSGALRFVLRDLARCKVRLSKPRIEPSITSQLQVEPDLQVAGVGHLGCRARARDGAWMTKLARTRVRARKGGQSWSLDNYEDMPARRVMICTVSTLRPAYLHSLPGA